MIKKINTAKMNEKEIQATLGEAKILELLNHPNIIRFREIYKNSKREVCLVMDYADGGDLAKLIKDHKEQNLKLKESLILSLFT